MTLIKIKKKLCEIVGIENDYFKIVDVLYHHFKWEASIKIEEKATGNIKYIDLVLKNKLADNVAKAKRKLLPYGFIVRMEGEE